ncbi:response regulator [Sphingomonas immobilis]|uniref:Response regulator n=1 Tax=Sphingomonas immobilis TaxID=3063997 RepID=A0ABT8ZXV6_9SPHN|nr:response regulator [Sphingomonas sp. CA1-15]MDO7841312.1 response regulator [Sphingomonas sp. CA1-15]
MQRPSVLVVDDEPANRMFAAKVLAAAGWSVAEAMDGTEAITAAVRNIPDLVVMDLDMPGLDGWQATAAIRAAEPPLSSVPILAYTSLRVTDAELLARGLDGRLPKPSSPDDFTEAAAGWRIDGQVDVARRLVAVFGEDEMTQLVTRFRAQLAEALAGLAGGADDLHAHRIAGVSGTLGFAAVSEAWLRLSEGDASATDAARRSARLAVAAIDRDWPVPAAS